VSKQLWNCEELNKNAKKREDRKSSIGFGWGGQVLLFPAI
jgi:hypothetical protein